MMLASFSVEEQDLIPPDPDAAPQGAKDIIIHPQEPSRRRHVERDAPAVHTWDQGKWCVFTVRSSRSRCSRRLMRVGSKVYAATRLKPLGSVLIVVDGRRRVTVDPGIPTMPGRSART